MNVQREEILIYFDGDGFDSVTYTNKSMALWGSIFDVRFGDPVGSILVA